MTAPGLGRILTAAMGTHLALGAVYAWSVLEPSLRERHGFSRFETQLTFGLTIACFTVAMLFAGPLLAARGARRPLRLAAVLYAVGYYVAGSFGATVPATLLGVGLLSGAGIGIGYVATLTAAVTASARRRGLVTGLVTGGFAAGSALTAPLTARALLLGWSVPDLFMVHAAVGLVVMLAASCWVPDQTAPAAGREADRPPVRAPRLLWWSVAGLFATSVAGLLVIGGLASIATRSGHGPAVGAGAVMALSFGNTLGRPLWGLLFDRIGPITAPLSLGGLTLAIGALAWLAASPSLLLLASLATGFCFAAGFVTYAATLARHLGPESVARLYPRVFLAYGLAAVIGPPLGGLLQELHGSPTVALLGAATLTLTMGLSLFGSRHQATGATPARHLPPDGELAPAPRLVDRAPRWHRLSAR